MSIKKIDEQLVEAVSVLVVQGAIGLAGVACGIAVLFVIPIQIIASFSTEPSDIWQLLLLEVAGIYLVRGILHFFKSREKTSEGQQ
jgi:membrane-bound ClpP family serine protease